MNGIEPEKKKNTLIRWVFGVLFLLLSLGMFSSSFIAGLLFLLAAVVSIPPAAKQLENKLNVRIPGIARFFVVFLLVAVAFAATPNTPTAVNNNTTAIAAPPTTVSGNEAIAVSSESASTPTPASAPTSQVTPTPTEIPTKTLAEKEPDSNYVTTDTPTSTKTPTPEQTPEVTSTLTSTSDYDSSLVKNYEVIQENDLSMKALTKPLSAYTSTELNSLPTNVRAEYRVVVSSDISKEELKSTLIQVVMDKTFKNNDIDEVVVFAYDRKEDVNNAFTLGKVEWCPNGDWGSMTPEIASSNDRSSYQYVFDIKDKVGNIDALDRPTEREYEIYDYYNKCYDAAWDNVDLSDPKATVDEDLIMQKVAEKYGITEEDASKIYTKVATYGIK